MRDISDHIVDLVQNSAFAKASLVELSIEENKEENRFKLRIKDNGCGMSDELQKAVFDPFVTSRKKRTGLGLPLLSQTASSCGGAVELWSMLGVGTEVFAWYRLDHIDRPPLGDIPETILSCLMEPEMELWFSHQFIGEDGSLQGEILLDTRELGIGRSIMELYAVKNYLIKEYEALGRSV